MVEPLAAEGVNTQPSAVPTFEKSPAASPETDSLNERPKVRDIAAAGVDGWDEYDAVGGSTSIVIVAASTLSPGPVCEVVEPSTAFWSMVRITVPLVGDALDTVTTYVEPEPVSDVTDQPELVPETVKSAVVRPVTFSEKTMS